jgi:uncharacterized membrane protein
MLVVDDHLCTWWPDQQCSTWLSDDDDDWVLCLLCFSFSLLCFVLLTLCVWKQVGVSDVYL